MNTVDRDMLASIRLSESCGVLRPFRAMIDLAMGDEQVFEVNCSGRTD